MKFRTIITAVYFSGLWISAHGQNNKGLKEYFKEYFNVGVAVSPRALTSDEAALIIKEFNSITAENAMKMGPIHPREDQYNWASWAH